MRRRSCRCPCRAGALRPFSGMVAEAGPFGGDGVAINRVKVDAGRFFDLADPRAVMINQRLADRVHVRPGDAAGPGWTAARIRPALVLRSE